MSNKNKRPLVIEGMVFKEEFVESLKKELTLAGYAAKAQMMDITPSQQLAFEILKEKGML